MKIAICASSLPSSLTIPQGFRIAKGAGFDAVELDISENGYLRPDSTESTVEDLKSASETMSLEFRSLCTGILWKYPLTSGDPEVVAKAKDIVRKGITFAKQLGADTLLVVPGVVTADVPYDIAYERAQSALRELAKDAVQHNIIIAVENVWNKFLLSPLEMRDFIDSIGSDYVQAYFDVGNVVVFGYPEQWIKILGSRIKKVHVKDFRTSIGNIQGFTNLLQGNVDWVAVREALKSIGYDDTITAEIGGYSTLPDLGMRHAADTLKRIFRAK